MDCQRADDRGLRGWGVAVLSGEGGGRAVGGVGRGVEGAERGARGWEVVLALVVLARVYLVVEAFVSLREVPVAVYATPEWTDLLPHL